MEMKKVLLIGNGAREHAIGEALMRSREGCELFVLGGALNPGLSAMTKGYKIGKTTDPKAVCDFALECKPDFAIIGPEDPIASGVTDELLKIGVRSVAPIKLLGQLESSKSFTRDLLEKYGIPGNPRYKVFLNEDGLSEWMQELGEYVVKSDGLMGGKGVQLSGEHLKTIDEGILFAKASIEKFGRVVVEEKFVGQEFSLMSFCDGKHVVDMPAVQDHKRAFDGDSGPNTGGMGTYSDANHSLPFLKPSDIADAHAINLAVAEALYKETGSYFKGILYGGFIAVKNGVRLIEYNARFGDPEVMNVLPILKTDFIAVCEAILDGTLDKLNTEFENKAVVVKYVCPEGYPENPVKNLKIDTSGVPSEVKLYFASLDEREDGLYLLGSRAVACTGIANTLEEAEIIAQKGAESVKGPVFFRKDIGTKELIEKRVSMLKEVRESL